MTVPDIVRTVVLALVHIVVAAFVTLAHVSDVVLVLVRANIFTVLAGPAFAAFFRVDRHEKSLLI